jgi:hypothetical protein
MKTKIFLSLPILLLLSLASFAEGEDTQSGFGELVVYRETSYILFPNLELHVYINGVYFASLKNREYASCQVESGDVIITASMNNMSLLDHSLTWEDFSQYSSHYKISVEADNTSYVFLDMPIKTSFIWNFQISMVQSNESTKRFSKRNQKIAEFTEFNKTMSLPDSTSATIEEVQQDIEKNNLYLMGLRLHLNDYRFEMPSESTRAIDLGLGYHILAVSNTTKIYMLTRINTSKINSDYTELDNSKMNLTNDFLIAFGNFKQYNDLILTYGTGNIIHMNMIFSEDDIHIIQSYSLGGHMSINYLVTDHVSLFFDMLVSTSFSSNSTYFKSRDFIEDFDLLHLNNYSIGFGTAIKLPLKSKTD